MSESEGVVELRCEADPRREFAVRMRHQVNPGIGIVAMLLFCGAGFFVLVQLVLGSPPSIIALVVMGLCVLAYAVAVVQTRVQAGARGRHKIRLDEQGIAVATTRGMSRHPWAAFNRWQENDTEFLAISRQKGHRPMAVVLPKDSMQADEVDLVRDVLHEAIDPDEDPISEAFVEMGWDEEPDKRR